MRLRQHIVALIGTLSILGATLTSGVAAGAEGAVTLSVTVLAGDPISAKLTDASMNPLAGDPPALGLSGTMVVRVRDVRGYATGWKLSLGTQDFSGNSGHFGSDLLAISPQTMILIQGNPDLTGLEGFDVDPMSTNPAPLWTASDRFGDGVYEMSLVSTLGLPEGPASGYLYTVILHIDGSAP